MMLLTLIESSLRFFLNGDKLTSMKDVPRLGKKGAVRDTMFIALLILTAIISNFLTL